MAVAHTAEAVRTEMLSTASLPATRQYQHWRDTVSATHLAWDLPARSDTAFQGQIRRDALGPAALIACRCDPCDGRRGRAEIARDDAAYYGLLCILEGGEWLQSDGEEIALSAGHFLLWDSTRRMRFRTPQKLRKVTLLLPQELLLSVLPDAADCVGRPISALEGAGALFVAQMRALLHSAHSLRSPQQDAALQSSLLLLTAALDMAGDMDKDDPAAATYKRVADYIHRNLDDPTLGPQSVADALGLSTRQLHRIFAARGWTPDRWIWHQRLLRCRHDLTLTPANGSIAQIAFRWGFNDAAHFSRAFRRSFGVSPKEWRNRPQQKRQTF